MIDNKHLSPEKISLACIDREYAKAFADGLNTSFIGKNIIFLPKTTSTNLIAKEQIEKLENGTVILADYQEGGKGRMGRTWLSPKGAGLWFTVIIKEPNISEEQFPVINAMISVVVFESVLTYGIKLDIKWPNDLLLNGKKVCGILSEIKKTDGKISLICGIGINTGKNMVFPEKLSAGSLELEGDWARESLLKKILEKFEVRYALLSTNGSEEILKIWKDHSVTLKSELYIIASDKHRIPCRATGIGPIGELIVEYRDGKKKSIYCGDEIIQKII